MNRMSLTRLSLAGMSLLSLTRMLRPTRVRVDEAAAFRYPLSSNSATGYAYPPSGPGAGY